MSASPTMRIGAPFVNAMKAPSVCGIASGIEPAFKAVMTSFAPRRVNTTFNPCSLKNPFSSAAMSGRYISPTPMMPTSNSIASVPEPDCVLVLLQADKQATKTKAKNKAMATFDFKTIPLTWNYDRTFIEDSDSVTNRIRGTSVARKTTLCLIRGNGIYESCPTDTRPADKPE